MNPEIVKSLRPMMKSDQHFEYIQTRFNLTWAEPRRIDVSILSNKEGLHFAKYLPTTKRTGLSLSRVLGYKIDNTDRKHIEKLRQYEEFYQYYPYFARVLI